MVEAHRVGAAGTEILIVATIGGGNLVVVLFLVDGECLVHDLEVDVLAAPAAFLGLADKGEARSIAETNNIIVPVDLLVWSFKPGRRTFAHHEVTILHVAHLAEKLERRWQRIGEQLAVGLAGDGCDRPGHRPHDLIHGEADVEALAGTAPLDGYVVLGAEHQPEDLGFGSGNLQIHNGKLRIEN